MKVLIKYEVVIMFMNHTLAKWLNNKLVLLVVSIFFGFGIGTIINMMMWYFSINYYFGLISAVVLTGFFFFIVGEQAEIQMKKHN